MTKFSLKYVQASTDRYIVQRVGFLRNSRDVCLASAQTAHIATVTSLPGWLSASAMVLPLGPRVLDTRADVAR